MKLPHVVIVGAGFGGITTAKALAKAPVEVTIVDQHNFHTFSPLLYQVATAGLAPEDIAPNTRGILQRDANLETRMAKVHGVDLDAREVMVDSGPPIPYDYLVLAAGAVSSDFGVPGVTEHALPLKTLTDATSIRSTVLRRFEEANANPSLVEDGTLTFVVAGGGPTGVELSGALAELFTKVLAKDFKNLDVRRARVILVEMADHLLGELLARLTGRGEARAGAARGRRAARRVDRVGRQGSCRARRRNRDRRAHRDLGRRREGQPARRCTRTRAGAARRGRGRRGPHRRRPS